MYASGTVTPTDVVMKRASFSQWNLDHCVPCGFRSLPDRFRNFPSLAMTKANSALLITNDDERGKSETPAAFDHLCHAVDVHQLVNEFAVAIVAVPVSLSFSCHTSVHFHHAGRSGALET